MKFIFFISVEQVTNESKALMRKALEEVNQILTFLILY